MNITWSNTVFPCHSFYQLSLVIESCRVSPLLPEVLPISFDSRESQWFRNRRVRFRANIRKAFVAFTILGYLKFFEKWPDSLIFLPLVMDILTANILLQIIFFSFTFGDIYIGSWSRVSRNKEKYNFIALHVIDKWLWTYIFDYIIYGKQT